MALERHPVHPLPRRSPATRKMHSRNAPTLFNDTRRPTTMDDQKPMSTKDEKYIPGVYEYLPITIFLTHVIQHASHQSTNQPNKLDGVNQSNLAVSTTRLTVSTHQARRVHPIKLCDFNQSRLMVSTTQDWRFQPPKTDGFNKIVRFKQDWRVQTIKLGGFNF